MKILVSDINGVARGELRISGGIAQSVGQDELPEQLVSHFQNLWNVGQEAAVRSYIKSRLASQSGYVFREVKGL